MQYVTLSNRSVKCINFNWIIVARYLLRHVFYLRFEPFISTGASGIAQLCRTDRDRWKAFESLARGPSPHTSRSFVSVVSMKIVIIYLKLYAVID